MFTLHAAPSDTSSFLSFRVLPVAAYFSSLFVKPLKEVLECFPRRPSLPCGLSRGHKLQDASERTVMTLSGSMPSGSLMRGLSLLQE